MQAKSDLHVHTKFSDRPSEWFLRRVGAPECFTEPMDVYRRCKARGMDYVTISDHNRIEGALEIAHLPGTFISSEITTYFPEDGCKIHCLVTAVTESQFRMIDELRPNIYEFQQYLVENDIIYSVAHPLFSVNDRMTVRHVEKLLLLFKRFEGINGTRDPRASELVNTIFRNLTPKMMEQMANTHDMDPLGPEPWKKFFTGGSDDHGGQYIASAFTTTPSAQSLAEFLGHLRAGRHEMGGKHGTSLQLAHSFCHIAYDYYKSKLSNDSASRGSLIADLLHRLLNRSTHASNNGLGGKVKGWVGGAVIARKRHKMNDVERIIFDEFREMVETDSRDINSNSDSEEQDSREDSLSGDETFRIASRISHKLGYSLAAKFLDRLRDGDIFESLQTIASLGPVALGVAPYLTAVKTQHKDERLLQSVARHFRIASSLENRSDRKAWATDTITDVNGVTTTIRALAGEARRRDLPLTVLASVSNCPSDDTINLRNFEPVGEFGLPEYESQKLAFPPFLDMLEYLEKQRFSELIISTPGPVGLTALLAANLLGLRTTGIYHTDFPRYVRQLSDDESMEGLAWKYMTWFYDQMDTIIVPSEAYRSKLIERGFDPRKLAVIGRGVDTQRFTPAKGDESLWSRGEERRPFTFIYTGRISAEKNVQMLLTSFEQVQKGQADAQLIVVGDGPLLESLRSRYESDRIRFTGFLDGDGLAAAYASSDAFVFPSTTDTFGNVVLEAMASGLPAIVSDKGGPSETVRRHGGGLVVDTESPGELVEAMNTFVANAGILEKCRIAAMQTAREASWDAVFDEFWNVRGDAIHPTPFSSTSSPASELNIKRSTSMHVEV